MNTPHKHCEVIKKWADGETIEARGTDGIWRVAVSPKWYVSTEYRVQPKSLVYSLSLMKKSSVDEYYILKMESERAKEAAERSPNFVRWLEENVEVIL